MTDPKSHEEFVSLAILQLDVENLRYDVRKQTEATKELVDAWKAAGKAVAFVKWASTLVTALGILWVFVTHWLRG